MTVLKYQRFPQESISTVIGGHEKITAVGLTGRGFVLGCESGRVYVVSFSGKIIKRSSPHSKAVNAVSVDHDGISFATCSDDCTVVLQSMHQKVEDQKFNIGEPVKCVTMQSVHSINKLTGSVNNNSGFQGGSKGPKSHKKGDKDIASRGRKICFLAGSASGMLSRYKASWFNQVHDVLFAGSGTAVRTIGWNGQALVAWTDATQMRVMNINTMSAVCYLEAPDGVGANSLFPSSLIWASETDLYIGWADTFRHLEIRSNGVSSPNSEKDQRVAAIHDSDVVVAKTATEWQTDFIICGVSNFDSAHLVLLGYAPPEDDQSGQMTGTGTGAAEMVEEGEQPGIHSDGSVFNRPEVQIVNRKTGVPVFVDVLPLEGSAIRGPWSYSLISTYHVHLVEMALSTDGAYGPRNPNDDSGTSGGAVDGQGNGRESVIGMRTIGDTSQKWDLADLLGARGGSRGFEPILYIVAPEDFVVAKVITVDDRVRKALFNKELRLAAEIAVGDRVGLRSFKFHDVLTLYVNDLLASQQDLLAASECLRLCKDDPLLWEQWVYSFAKANKLHSVCQRIPLEQPRLPLVTYELCIEELMNTCVYHPVYVLLCVQQWARIRPAIFDADALTKRIRGFRDEDPYFLAVLGVLYLEKQEFELAINCSLDAAVGMSQADRYPSEKRRAQQEIELLRLYRSLLGEELYETEAVLQSDNADEQRGNGTMSGENEDILFASSDSKTGLDAPRTLHNFEYVFKTIEENRLYSLVSERIPDLVKLDLVRAVAFLIKARDTFPVAAVVQALRNASSSSSKGGRGTSSSQDDRYALYWYLHLTFVLFPESYNTIHFAEFHSLQVSLYAEFTPKTDLRRVRGKNGDTRKDRIDKSTSAFHLKTLSEGIPVPLDESLFPSTDLFAVSSLSMGASVNGEVAPVGGGRFMVREGPPSFFLYFLKKAHLAPLALALQECEKKCLYNEIIFIYAKMGRLEAALSMLLEKTGDVLLAVDFVETFQGSTRGKGRGDEDTGAGEEFTMSKTEGKEKDRVGVDDSMESGQSGHSIATVSSLSDSVSGNGVLWKLILEHCQQDASAMSELLKVVGVCHLNPAHVIKRIPDKMKLPELRGRMLHIHSLRDFKSFVTDRCNDILAEDTVDLQRRLNQLQRRSIKVNPREVRCMACSRPLFVAGPVATAREAVAASGEPGSSEMSIDLGAERNDRQIWGGQASANTGVVVFSPREAYHISCYASHGQAGLLHAG